MALYHTHRPQDFSLLIGQEHIIQTLSNQILQNHLSHAYLFSGPRGVGKTTTARIIAKAANCTQRNATDAAPCNVCSSCREITAGNAIDVIEIDAASHTGVENVRTNIIENAQFKPTRSAHKVFIIDEVHMLSTSAFNALLKIMEEPPSHVIFILATTELHKIPQTIISRCQQFTFHRITTPILIAHLKEIATKEGMTIAGEVLERIAEKSDGCVRDALSLLDQLMTLGTKEITAETAAFILPIVHHEHTLHLLSTLFQKNVAEGFAVLSSLAADQHDIIAIADDIIDTLRMVMIIAANPKQQQQQWNISADMMNQLQQFATQLPPKELIALIDLFLKRRQEIKSAPLATLPLEMAVFAWCADAIPPVPENKTTPIEITKTEEIKKEEPLPQTEPAKLFTKKQVEDIWPKFLSKMETVSPTLVIVLKAITIDKVEGATLHLTAPFSFHKDKLLETGPRGQIQTVLQELLHTPIAIAAETISSTNEKMSSGAEDLAALVGGTVV